MATKIIWNDIATPIGEEALRLANARSDVEITGNILCKFPSGITSSQGLLTMTVAQSGISSVKYDSLEQYFYAGDMQKMNEQMQDFDVLIGASSLGLELMVDLATKLQKPLVSIAFGLSRQQVGLLQKATSVVPVFRNENLCYDVKWLMRQIDETSEDRTAVAGKILTIADMMSKRSTRTGRFYDLDEIQIRPVA